MYKIFDKFQFLSIEFLIQIFIWFYFIIAIEKDYMEQVSIIPLNTREYYKNDGNQNAS